MESGLPVFSPLYLCTRVCLHWLVLKLAKVIKISHCNRPNIIPKCYWHCMEKNLHKKTNKNLDLYMDLLSAAERRGTPVLLSASVSDNSGNSPQMAAPRRSSEIDQSMQRLHVGWGYANHGILLILDDNLNYNLLIWAK